MTIAEQRREGNRILWAAMMNRRSIVRERRDLALAPDESVCPACASGYHAAPEGCGCFKCDCACHK